MNEATKIIDNEEIFDRILITIINQKQIKINRFRKYNYNYKQLKWLVTSPVMDTKYQPKKES